MPITVTLCVLQVSNNTGILNTCTQLWLLESNPHGFNKGCISKFHLGSRIRQTPEEGRWTYQLKRCGNNNNDEDNSPKILNDKNHQASSQKFGKLLAKYINLFTKYGNLFALFLYTFKLENFRDFSVLYLLVLFIAKVSCTIFCIMLKKS